MIQEPRPQSPTQQITEIARRYSNSGVNPHDHLFCAAVLAIARLREEDLRVVLLGAQAKEGGS